MSYIIRKWVSDDEAKLRKTDVLKIIKNYKIHKEDADDLKKCLDMLDSRDPLPCPWNPVDYQFYTRKWRASVQADVSPPPRKLDPNIKVGHFYMLKADKSHHNSRNQEYLVFI